MISWQSCPRSDKERSETYSSLTGRKLIIKVSSCIHFHRFFHFIGPFNVVIFLHTSPDIVCGSSKLKYTGMKGPICWWPVRLFSASYSVKVAVKALKQCTKAMRAEFEREAAIMAKLKHPNIVKFYGVSSDVDGLLLIYEFMDLGDLKTYLRERSRLTL